MKLRDLDIIVTAPPAPGWGGRYWQLVKLTTDDGITGWGEVYAAAVGPDAMAAVIADVFGRHMEGESAENVERMFRRVHSSGFTGRPDPTVMGAFSGPRSPAGTSSARRGGGRSPRFSAGGSTTASGPTPISIPCPPTTRPRSGSRRRWPERPRPRRWRAATRR